MTRGTRYQLASSRLAGSPSHLEQLLQLLGAPDAYWIAQTPIGFTPVAGFDIDAEGTGFSKFVLSEKVTDREIETLLVLMASRMPGLSVEFRSEDAGRDTRGFRLVLGKLEAGRGSPSGDIAWGTLPPHSSLIGSK